MGFRLAASLDRFAHSFSSRTKQLLSRFIIYLSISYASSLYKLYLSVCIQFTYENLAFFAGLFFKCLWIQFCCGCIKFNIFWLDKSHTFHSIYGDLVERKTLNAINYVDEIQLNRISAHATYHRCRAQHVHDEQYIIRDYYYYFSVHMVFYSHRVDFAILLK